jgi:hypothetical protein
MPTTPLPDLSQLTTASLRSTALNPLRHGVAFTSVLSMYQLPPGCPDRTRVQILDRVAGGRAFLVRIDDPASPAHSQTFTIDHWNLDAGCVFSFHGHPGRWTDWTPEGRTIRQWYLDLTIAEEPTTTEWHTHAQSWKITRKWKD